MDEELLKQVESLLYDPMTGKIIGLLVGVLVIFGIAGFFQKLLINRISDNTLRYRARKVFQMGSLALCIVLAISIFSERVTEFTVAFGLAGAGITIALQEVITSFAGWFAITFGHAYRVGDRVRIGDIRGDVIDIGLMKTTLMELGDWVNGDLYNGKLVRMANSMAVKNPVYHYSADYPFLWDEIVIPIRYGSNLPLARKIMEESAWEVTGEYAQDARKTWEKVVRKYMVENANVEPMISISIDENWATYTIRYVTDYKLRRATKDRIYEAILTRIDRSDNEVRLASAAFEIISVPDLTLHGDIKGDGPSSNSISSKKAHGETKA